MMPSRGQKASRSSRSQKLISFILEFNRLRVEEVEDPAVREEMREVKRIWGDLGLASSSNLPELDDEE